MFSEMQPKFDQAGIATFPVSLDSGKKPAVSNWQHMGRHASRQLARRPEFEKAGIGFICGQRSGITVLDFDEADEKGFADALQSHGSSPVVVKTASGKFHAYYRYNGEGRHIRPFQGKPIDILGKGLVIAPNSLKEGRRYEFIEGGIDDFHRLPVMQGLESILKREPKKIAPRQNDVAQILEGHRTNTLFAVLRDYAVSNTVTPESLLAFARQWNIQNCQPPLTDTEVQGQVNGVLKLLKVGRCWAPATTQKIIIEVEEMNALDPDSFWLLQKLKAAHWQRTEFILANSYSGSLGWTLRRFKKAILQLTPRFIKCLSAGGKNEHDPPRYCFRGG